MAEHTQTLSHWHKHIEGLKLSTQEFYSGVEFAVQSRDLPDAKFSRVEYKEGGLFSGRREYLRIKRGELYFDVCAAPFANGMFFSSRLFAEGSFLEGLGAFGSFMKVLFKPDTFYKTDTALMYQSLVHHALLEVVDSFTSGANLPPLPESERKPVMREFYH